MTVQHDEWKIAWMAAVKFVMQLDAKVAADLSAFAARAGRDVSEVVTEAIAEYLHRRRLRPAFVAALDEVLSDHDELLTRLAK